MVPFGPACFPPTWSVVRVAVDERLALVGISGMARVEALMALSIVFLTVEITKQDPTRPRLSERVPWVVAFLFGLIHGFGFAG